MDKLLELLKKAKAAKGSPIKVESASLSEKVIENFSAKFQGLKPTSFDEQTRTVSCVYMDFDQKIRRFNPWFGEYYIQFQRGGAVLDRLQSGNAPFLKDHDSTTVDNVIGNIVTGDDTTAKLRIASTPDVEIYYQKIKDKILSNVSVGVDILELVDISPEPDPAESDNPDYQPPPPVFLITEYEPFEISLVTIPAITKAQIFSNQGTRQNLSHTKQSRTGVNKMKLTKEQILRLKELRKKAKSDELSQAEIAELSNLEARLAASGQILSDAENAEPVDEPAPASEPETTEPETTEPGEEVKPAEGAKLSVSEALAVIDLVKQHGLDEKFGRELIKKKTSLKDAKLEIILAKADKQDAEGNGSTRGRFTAGEDSEMIGVEKALLHRFDPKRNKFDQGNKFGRMSLLELGKHFLARAGHNVNGLDSLGLSKEMLMSSSDFPKALENVINKYVIQTYNDVTRTFLPISRERSVSDFKQITGIELSEFDKLDKLPESGEYKYGTISEGRERYALATYGKIFSVTRKLLINDDVNLIAEALRQMAQSTARMENEVAWCLLLATWTNGVADITTLGNGAVMSDGYNVFGTEHANTVAAKLQVDTDSQAGVDAVEQKLMAQAGPKGLSKLRLQGKYLIFGPKNKLAAARLNGPISATEAGNINPYAGQFEPIMEHLITDKRFILAADPNQTAMLEHAYLLGQQTPFTERNENFKNDSIDFKIRQDFGVGLMGYKGFARGTES